MKIQKVVEFVVLYIYAAIKWFFAPPEPLGIRAHLVTLFRDKVGEPAHGVCVFLIPNHVKPDTFSHDLWGPFGFSSKVTLFKKHLYGRDTWGSPSVLHLEVNPELGQLAKNHPDHWILLTGVRQFWGRHPWPLHDHDKFILPWESI